MELKHIDQYVTQEIQAVLIVPYGIETWYA